MQLPTELVLMIAEQTEKSDFSALARVNRDLYGILNDRLYQHNIRQTGDGICKAAELGCRPAIERFLRLGFDARQPYAPCPTSRYDEFLGVAGRSLEHPLLHATQYGHVDIVRYLLEAGSDPDVRAGNRLTPLLIASKHGFLTIVRALKEAGGEGNMYPEGDPNFLEMFQKTPIREAAYGGQLNVVRYLISVSEDAHSLASRCFLEAAASGNVELISYLIDNGAHVNYRGWVSEGQHTHDRGTALFFAVKHNHPETVRLLLQHGATIREAIGSGTPDVGTTLSRLAVRLGFGEVLKILLDHDASGLNDLLDCAIANGNPAIVDVLLAAFQDDPIWLFTHMQSAIKVGHADIVDLLIKKGFNEVEAMYFAVFNDSERIVEHLLRCGVDPNLDLPNTRKNPLRLALAMNNIPITEVILRYVAQIDPVDLQRFRQSKRNVMLEQFLLLSPLPDSFYGP
jgi:ankyrin repeat protein